MAIKPIPCENLNQRVNLLAMLEEYKKTARSTEHIMIDGLMKQVEGSREINLELVSTVEKITGFASDGFFEKILERLE